MTSTVSLPDSVRFVWSNVLFAAPSPEGTRPLLRSLVLLTLLAGLLLFPTIAFPLFEPDEGRYAEIPREMLVRGEWVVPYLHGEPYLDKPPLLYWLVMLSYRVFGVEVWAARLVPALATLGTVLLTYLFGVRLLGERAGFRGALLLCLAPGFVGMSRLLLMDGLLVFLTTLAVFATFEAVRGDRLIWGWWMLAALACGLGVLTKGPVILLLLVPPLIVHRWLTQTATPQSDSESLARSASEGCPQSDSESLARSASEGCPQSDSESLARSASEGRPSLALRASNPFLRAEISWRAIAAFVAVIAVVALPWFVVLCVREPIFARYFLWEHNVMRFVSPFDHIRPVWFYLPILLGGLLPGTLLGWSFVQLLLSGRSEDAARRPQELGFLLLVSGWCVFFFSMSGCKLPTYVLPAFPPLALALGWLLSGSGWERSRLPAWIGATCYILLFVGHNVGLPWYASYRSPLARGDVLAAYCGNPDETVICYPRECNTVAFHLRRDDLRNYRSREIEELRAALRERPRTVVLCTHRHSLGGLRQALPPELYLKDETRFTLPTLSWLPAGLGRRVPAWAGETALGLCDLVVVERRTP